MKITIKNKPLAIEIDSYLQATIGEIAEKLREEITHPPIRQRPPVKAGELGPRIRYEAVNPLQRPRLRLWQTVADNQELQERIKQLFEEALERAESE